MVLEVFEIMIITLGCVFTGWIGSLYCCSGDMYEEYGIERSSCFPNFWKKKRESFNKYAQTMAEI